jgi:hypothetical protein
MGDLDPLAGAGEEDGVVADDVAAAQRREADAARAALAVAVVDGAAVERLALRGSDDLAHAQRRAARRVDLHAVMRLDDLDVEALGERARRDVDQLHDHVDADAHVRRHDDRDVLGMRRDLCLLGGVEAGRADDGGDAQLAAEGEVGQRSLRPREVDQHLARGERGSRVGADDDAAGPAEEGAGVAADAGAARHVERRRENQVGAGGERLDQRLAHPARRAGDGDAATRRGATRAGHEVGSSGG